jgi:serine/threonine protein kinase/Tol biopolymer transport system component
MALSASDRLGPYEILALIGAGGMGEVYRARDTKLKRDVAIKVLPEAFARDAERMARFQREAELLASLNHPNIAQIYGLADSNGARALVMELVPGRTLRGPLPLGTALKYAVQIASALEAAHEKGIIHRDLKPANIMVTPAGAVKVLDFGLAAQSREINATSPEDSPTVTISAPPTQAGVIHGTARYMSPEQAEGKAVDKRSDVWSFGVVLYEMLTGARCFDGKTPAHAVIHVLEQEPDWRKLPASTPSALRELLERCLRKDPTQRPRDIGDLRLQIRDLVERPAVQAGAPEATPGSVTKLWPAIASLLALVVLGLGYFVFRPRSAPPAKITRFEIPPVPNANLTNILTLSPDGQKLAFVANVSGVNQIWVRSMDSTVPRPLAGTELVVGIPFWSADSRYVVFSVQGKLEKIEASGGPAQVLCAIPGALGGGWTRDDQIVFSTNNRSGLLRVSAAGGEPAPVTALSGQEALHVSPSPLRDGHHFVYLRLTDPANGGVYLGSLDAKPGEQASKKLLSDTSLVEYVASSDSNGSGYLLFTRSGTLMAQPFDENHLETVGQALPVAERVASNIALGNGFSASNGALVYRAGGPLGEQQLTWFDRQGKSLGAVVDPFIINAASAPALSPDGKRIAYARSETSGNAQIWLFELARGINSPFTVGSGDNRNPIWSPDGSRIAFFSRREGTGGIYLKSSNLGGGDELLYKATKDAPVGPPISWSRDGRFITYGTGGIGVWMLPVNGPGERKPMQLVGPEFNQRAARFSPDEKFFSYISLKSGRDEVYARAFDSSGGPAAKASGREWPVSKDGGDGAHWRGDGKEIFYMAPDRTIMAVDVKTNPEPFGTPKPLFKTNARVPYWEVSPNGQRFLIPVQVGANSPGPYTVVLNWQAAVKK